MPITLSLSAADIDSEALQNLTRELCQDLSDETGSTAILATRAAELGTRAGDIPVYGQIILAALSGGGLAVGLVNVLKAYVQRKPSLHFELQTKNGVKIKIKGDDLRSADMARLTQAIKKALEDE